MTRLWYISIIMKRGILIYTLLGILLQTGLSSQIYVDSSLVGKQIQSIRLIGNHKTKNHVILREMKQKEGDFLNLGLLEEDRNRIQDLKIFNRVMIVAEPSGEKAELTIAITEFWYIFPYPILHINEKDWSKISYGAGITHLNFRGRAENLSFQFKLGYNPLVEFGYINPWFAGPKKLRTNINVAYKKVRSKHIEKNENREVNENHMGINTYIGKKLGFHSLMSMFLGYTRISYSPAIQGKTISSSGKDQFPMLGMFVTLDYRDLKEYPSKGWYVRTYILKKGYPGSSIDYLKLGIDVRKYIPVFLRGSMALRTLIDLSKGTIPLYDHLFLGYGERIRGHFYEKYEGENRSLFGMALRFPVLPIKYYNPSDEYYFSDFRFGVNMGLFIDSGITWFQGESLKRDMFNTGYGCGLHIFLPYNTVIRLEIAFDEKGRKQYIVDLNVDI